MLENGIIKLLNTDKRFGFIKAQKGADCHFSFQIVGRTRDLKVGAAVAFERGTDRNGRETARKFMFGEVLPATEWAVSQTGIPCEVWANTVIALVDGKPYEIGVRNRETLAFSQGTVREWQSGTVRPNATIPQRYAAAVLAAVQEFVAQRIAQQAAADRANRALSLLLDAWNRGECPAGLAFDNDAAGTIYAPLYRHGDAVFVAYAGGGDDLFDFWMGVKWMTVQDLAAMRPIWRSNTPQNYEAVEGWETVPAPEPKEESKVEKSIEFVNLTPHAVVITAADGSTVTVEPSGALARCEETREQVGQIAGVPVWSIGMGAVVGLPEPQVGKVYIVSALVMAQVPNRADVFAPGPAIRDDKGRVIGCQGLSATPRAAAHIRRGLQTDGYKVVEIGAE